MTFFPQQLKPGQCVTVPVDVKQNKNYPPSVHCAPIAATQVLDDRAQICRDTTNDGRVRITVRFASELGGPFGAGVTEEYQYWHNVPTNSFMGIFKPVGLLMAKLQNPDAFSPYTFLATENGQLNLTAGNWGQLYKADDLECAKRAVAGALVCWGYGVEDQELINFGKQFYPSDTQTVGADLPAQDRIDAQIGEKLPTRRGPAEAPSAKLITLAADQAVRPNGLPHMAEFTGNPHLLGAVGSVHLDVKANDVMPFNINFAPINAEVVTNDVAFLDFMVDPMKFASSDEPPFVCVRFKSEVGGPLGAVVLNDPKDKEGLSPYDLCVDDKKEIYAYKEVGGENKKFKVDSIERAAFAIASVLGVYAYSNANMNFVMKHFADQLYANRAQLTTAGDVLPSKDQLANQTKLSKNDENFELRMEMNRQHIEACNKSFWSLGCLTPVTTEM